MLENLAPQPADALLALIKQYAADDRPGKIDLGVGVYRDAHGHTPILQCIKAAEKELAEGQATKAYLGPEGDAGFVEALKPILFQSLFGDLQNRIAAIQTPGGSGALRIAGELIAAARPKSRILVGMPTWPNHAPILTAAGLTVVPYKSFDLASQTFTVAHTLDAIDCANPGDAILLHGCCNNPTGTDPDADEWVELARKISQRGILPLVDIAYQGFGEGLEQDTAGLRTLLQYVPQAIVAYSCNKNFAMYRDRVGALFVVAKDKSQTETIWSNLCALARVNWSMPPDHGAAAVRTVLENPTLSNQWREELKTMRARIIEVRSALADADHRFDFVRRQKGLFTNFHLTPEAVAKLRDDHSIYMASSGRANLAGMKTTDAAQVASALAEVAEERA